MAFTQPIDVRFSDLDALEHVNHAVHLSYLEHARTRWWRSLLGDRPFRDEGFLVARVEIDYRLPILLGDQVRVELRCVEVGRTSFTLAYQVVGGVGILAEARSVQVMLDFSSMRPRELSPETRAWLETQG